MALGRPILLTVLAVSVHALRQGTDASRTHPVGGSALVATEAHAGTHMRPEVVARLLDQVEHSWVLKRVQELEHHVQSGVAREEMRVSCTKVADAIIRGSGGDQDKVHVYMATVCATKEMPDADRPACQRFADKMVKFMRGDQRFNREELDSSNFCHNLWDTEINTTATDEESHEEASRQEQEKKAAEEKAVTDAAKAKADEEKAKQDAVLATERAEAEEKLAKLQADRLAKEQKQKEEKEAEDAIRDAAKKASEPELKVEKNQTSNATSMVVHEEHDAISETRAAIERTKKMLAAAKDMVKPAEPAKEVASNATGSAANASNATAVVAETEVVAANATSNATNAGATPANASNASAEAVAAPVAVEAPVVAAVAVVANATTSEANASSPALRSIAKEVGRPTRHEDGHVNATQSMWGSIAEHAGKIVAAVAAPIANLVGGSSSKMAEPLGSITMKETKVAEQLGNTSTNATVATNTSSAAPNATAPVTANASNTSAVSTAEADAAKAIAAATA